MIYLGVNGMSEALKKYKIQFTDISVPGYKNQSVDPVGFMVHHTAGGGGEEASRGVVRQGRRDLPGPLAHYYIDREGEIFFVTKGLANHAGLGSPTVLNRVRKGENVGSPGVSLIGGNKHFLGVEIENNGVGEPYPPAVYLAAVGLVAAECLLHGWDPKVCVIGHKEWTKRKPDPSFDMGKFRDDVKNLMPLLKVNAEQQQQQGDGSSDDAGLLVAYKFFELAQLYQRLLNVTLRKGSKGVEVVLLQQKLNSLSASDTDLTVDGDFGAETEKKVKIFQAFAQLTPDGVVGKKTWEKLL